MANSRHHSSRGRAHSASSSRGGGSEGGQKKLPPIPERSPSSGRKMVGVGVERERGTDAKNRHNLACGSGILFDTKGVDLSGKRDRVSITLAKYRGGRGREVVVPPSPEKRLRSGKDMPVVTAAVAVAEARDDEDDRPPAPASVGSSAAAAKGVPQVVANRPVEEIAIPSPLTPAIVAAPSPSAAEKNGVHVDKDAEGTGRVRERLEPINLRARASRGGARSSSGVRGGGGAGSAPSELRQSQSQKARSFSEPEAASVTTSKSSSSLARAPSNVTSASSGGERSLKFQDPDVSVASGDANSRPGLVAPSSPIKTVAHHVGVTSVPRAHAGPLSFFGRDTIVKDSVARGSVGAEQITMHSSVKVSDIQSLHLPHSAEIDHQPAIRGRDAASVTGAGSARSRPFAALSSSDTIVSEAGSIVSGDIPMVPLVPAVTPSKISRERIAPMLGTTCDDGRGQDGAVERLGMSDARHATEPSWDYQQTRRGAEKAVDSFARPVGTGEVLEELRLYDGDADEVMDSFMKDPRDVGRSSDTRDQYQLGRLRARINWRQEARPSKAWTYDEEDDESTKALRHSRIKTVRNLYTSHHLSVVDDKDGRDDDCNKVHTRDQERQHAGLERECHAPLISESTTVHDMPSITHSESPRPGVGPAANWTSSSTAATGGPSSTNNTGDLTRRTLAKSQGGSGEAGPNAGNAGPTKSSPQRRHPSIAMGESFRSVTSGNGDGGGGMRSATGHTVSAAPCLHRNHPFIADSKSSRSVASAAAGGGGSRSSVADRTDSTAPSLQHGRAIISQSLTSSASGAETGEAASPSEGRGARMPPRRPTSPRSSVSTRPPRSPTSSQSLHSQPHSQKQLQAQTPTPNVLGSSTPRSTSQKDGEDSSFELSEYRGKVFVKMLHLLHDLSPAGGGHVRDESDTSEIKDRIIDEGRTSSCSIAELKLIQKLTEEEMSRILHEFETNNSLIERREARALRGMPNLKDGSAAGDDLNGDNVDFHKVEGPGVDEEEKEKSALDSDGNDNDRSPPEKIMYHHDGSGMLSISSKLSDVTSPTCHDGFELDEIIPAASHHSHLQATTPVSRPMQTIPKTGGSGDYNVHHKNRKSLPSSFSLPSPLSPVAAAAASVAATISLSASGTNSRKEQSFLEQHHLSSVLEILDEVRPSKDGSSEDNIEGKQRDCKEVGGEKNSKCQHRNKKPPALQAKIDVRPPVNSSSIPGADGIDAETCGDSPSQKHERLHNNALASVSEVINNQQEYDTKEGEQKDREESSPKSRAENTPRKGEKEQEKMPESEYKLEDAIGTNKSKEEASTRKTAAGFLASSRKRAQRMVREEHFHDGIMSAVAKARAKDTDAELDEVTSILTMYEEVAKVEAMRKREETNNRVKENDDGAREKLLHLESENVQVTTADCNVDMKEVTPLDGLNLSKKVTFVEPPPMPEEQVICGCAIQ